MLAKVKIADAALAAADAPERARIEFVAPFVEAAARVIMQECGDCFIEACVDGVMAMRVHKPDRSPAKLGMPAAPLFTTQATRRRASSNRRIAGRQVWVLANRSTSAASNASCSHGWAAGASSAFTSNRQPANASASP